MKIMIVDDERTIRRSLAAYLEDRGCEVECFETSTEALEHLGGEEYDLAIVDIRLPGLDGEGFMREALLIRPEMQFLVYTGLTGYKMPQDLIEKGIEVWQVLQKPLIELSDLYRMIERVLMEKEQA